jgi:hypothetical protein
MFAGYSYFIDSYIVYWKDGVLGCRAALTVTVCQGAIVPESVSSPSFVIRPPKLRKKCYGLCICRRYLVTIFPIYNRAWALRGLINESVTDTVAEGRGRPVDESVTVPVMIPSVLPVSKLTEINCEAVCPYWSAAATKMVCVPSFRDIDAEKVLLLTDA